MPLNGKELQLSSRILRHATHSARWWGRVTLICLMKWCMHVLTWP